MKSITSRKLYISIRDVLEGTKTKVGVSITILSSNISVEFFLRNITRTHVI